jgi:hypothetical protein
LYKEIAASIMVGVGEYQPAQAPRVPLEGSISQPPTNGYDSNLSHTGLIR